MKHALRFAARAGLAVALAAVALPASAQGVYGGNAINVGPPALVREQIPPRPGRGYVWQAGYWRWNGGRYVWVRGAYVRPPYASAAWIPGHWAHTRYGWVWRRGHWA
jgi:hypothetical protein